MPSGTKVNRRGRRRAGTQYRQHREEMRGYLKEAARVLKPEGRILINPVPNKFLEDSRTLLEQLGLTYNVQHICGLPGRESDLWERYHRAMLTKST
tara:strand:- start:10055 stop:10342 length:288 start_codon:yes stop_codon:yes gene_type:complete